jgi:hypothetical protein
MENLSQLSIDKKRRAFFKNAAGPVNGAEFDLLNISSGAGIIDYLWLADRPGVSGFPQFDHSLRIYTDGKTTPDVDMDLGLFFGYADGQIYSQENIHSDHWTARSGTISHIWGYGGTCRLPIPFRDGIRVCVANTNNTPVSAVFSQIDYRTVVDNPSLAVPPYTLNTIGNKWIGNRLTAAATSSPVLAAIPEGNPGVIVGHSMAGRGGSSYDYLERYIALCVDGETTPSIQSSGTEDWFTGSDYFFNGQTPLSSHGAMALGAGPYDQNSVLVSGFSALVDLLALNGGFPFTSSAILKWLHHPATSVSADYGSCVFYYRSTTP